VKKLKLQRREPFGAPDPDLEGGLLTQIIPVTITLTGIHLTEPEPRKREGRVGALVFQTIISTSAELQATTPRFTTVPPQTLSILYTV